MRGQLSHSLVKALRRVPAFAPLDDHDLLQIVGASVNLHWPAGSKVFEHGSPAEALYIVLAGKVRIFATLDGSETDIATIGPGDFFGEFSLLREETHSKDAEAIEDSELLVVPEQSFQALLNSDPVLADHVAKKMEQRIVESDRALKLS